MKKRLNPDQIEQLSKQFTEIMRKQKFMCKEDKRQAAREFALKKGIKPDFFANLVVPKLSY